MRRLIVILGVILAAAVVGAPAVAQQEDDLVVVVNAYNPFITITEDDLARIFLKKRGTWMNEQDAFPVDQTEASAVRRRFSARVLKKDVDSVKRYWQQQVFSGKAVPPPALDGDAAVLEFVRAHPYGVGYVSRSANLGDNVKVIAVTR